MADDGKSRYEYTWDDVCGDLAMGSRLTYHEAVSVRDGIEPTGMHPYDALPPLLALFGDGSVETKVQGIRALMERRRFEFE